MRINKVICLIYMCNTGYASLTCDNIKNVYQQNDCCQNSAETIKNNEYCSDSGGRVTFDSIKTDHITIGGAVITGKVDDHFMSSIDDTNKLDSFINGPFAKLSNGDNTSTPFYGMYKEQFFPYETRISYSNGKRVMIESDMAKQIRDTTGKPPMYALYSTTKPITAMTGLAMTENSYIINNFFPKIQDPINMYLPEFSTEISSKKKIRKWDRATKNSSFFSYADLNALGFMSVQTVDGKHNIVSTLPNGNTAIIVSDVDSTDLAQLYPNLGVLTVATDFDADYTLSASTLASLPANTWGIYKDQTLRTVDPVAKRTLDTLQDKNGRDRFKDDPLYAFTVIMPAGSQLTVDGVRGLRKVMQFKIAKQSRDFTGLDCLGHKTGHAYPFLGGFSYTSFPSVWQQNAMYAFFANAAFLSVTYDEYGKVPYTNEAPSSSVGFPKWMKTSTFMHFMASTPTVAQPGEEFIYSLSYDIFATAITVVYEAYKHPEKFPNRNALGYVDLTTGLGGTGYNKDTRLDETLFDVMTEFVFEPCGLTRDDVVAYYDTEFDANFTVIKEDSRIDRLVPQMDWYYAAFAANAYRPLVGLSPLPPDRAYPMASIYKDLITAFGDFLSPAEGEFLPSNLWGVASGLYSLYTAGHKTGDVLNPYYMGFKTFSADKRDQFYGGGAGLIASAEGVEKIFKVLVNGGRKDDGTRVFSQTLVGAMSRPLYTSSEDIADVTKFFDNGRGNSRGKTSIGLGFFIAQDPDSKTLGNSLIGHKTAYHGGWGGTFAAFNGDSYRVEFTSTQFSSAHLGEDYGFYPGLEYMDQKKSLQFSQSLLDL